MDIMAVAAIEKTEVQGAREPPCREEICDIKTFENGWALKQKFEQIKQDSKESRWCARGECEQELRTN